VNLKAVGIFFVRGFQLPKVGTAFVDVSEFGMHPPVGTVEVCLCFLPGLHEVAVPLLLGAQSGLEGL